MSFQHLSMADFIDRRDEFEQVVDIRDPQSFTQGHIPGASHLTNENVQEFLQSADREKPVVVCCYHGNSSQQAAAFLFDQGFAQAYSLDGGYASWNTVNPE